MWNLYELPKSVYSYSNVGGFGIDGSISSMIGASLCNPHKLIFLIVGDLATFYDLNSIGNRHIGTNIRIMVINNGTGFEMRHSSNRGDIFKEDADILFAAGGHFGNQSRTLLKDYSVNLGFEYMCADNKEKFIEVLPQFVSEEPRNKPVLLEVFVDVMSEYDSFEITKHVISSKSRYAKKMVKNVIGENGVQKVKTLLKRNHKF